MTKIKKKNVIIKNISAQFVVIVIRKSFLTIIY